VRGQVRSVHRCAWIAVLLWMYASMASATSPAADGIHAIFKAPNGDTIEFDTRTGAIRLPRSPDGKLEDCSDPYQYCVTDHHGFSFSYFRSCKDIPDGLRLRFPPRIVSVLHGHLWTVSNSAPNYLFHSVIGQGLVGILVGPTPSFDFRSALHNPNFSVFDFEAREYHIVGSDGILACKD